MKITKTQRGACLAAMRRIADGGHVTECIERGRKDEAVGYALHEIGWMDRNPDFFDYARGMRDGVPEYRPDQALMALALCVTISEAA